MSDMTATPLLLAGEWSEGAGGATIDVENPADQSIVAKVAVADERDVEAATRAARAAQPPWAALPVAERAAVLHRLAVLIERDAERLARIIVSEVGKPITEARGEVGGAAGFCRFFAGIAPVQGGEILPSAMARSELWSRREPIGVVGAIIPWNFPMALTCRKLAPALVTGNALVMKPAELTPLSALAIAELAVEAGVPAGILSVLPGPGSVIGSALVRSPEVGFVTMTGSVRAGRSILHDAADKVIPVSLELGGKAPFIVFDDVDLDEAADAAVYMRLMNNGQACVCNERTYVHASVYDDFLDKVAQRMKQVVVGNPMNDSTQVGPKVSAAELSNVERIVSASLASGATLVSGGDRPQGGAFDRGYWYAPTVLADLAPDSPALREEVFGPVMPIVPFRDESEVVDLANDTDYGLSAYLYTRSFPRVMRMLRGLKTGEVFVNRVGPEESNGFHSGWGLSGLGGDDGPLGLELYTRRQTAYVSWDDLS